jgi:hypothetical protein
MEWIVYASYQLETNEIHPRLARYPGAMARTCDDHLTIVLAQDANSMASTKSWVVEPSTAKER